MIGRVLLVQDLIDINLPDKEGKTPLMASCSAGNTCILTLLRTCFFFGESGGGCKERSRQGLDSDKHAEKPVAGNSVQRTAEEPALYFCFLEGNCCCFEAGAGSSFAGWSRSWPRRQNCEGLRFWPQQLV